HSAHEAKFGLQPSLWPKGLERHRVTSG
ncbi:gametolysin peptidase M11 family protein, partial [Vibrio parahaemolyticus EKP-008]